MAKPTQGRCGKRCAAERGIEGERKTRRKREEEEEYLFYESMSLNLIKCYQIMKNQEYPFKFKYYHFNNFKTRQYAFMIIFLEINV